MLHTDNKQQIRKWIQSPSKRRSDVTPGAAAHPPFRCNAGWIEMNSQRIQTIRQSDGSKTETTLILCGYSRERANNRGDSLYKRRWGEEKLEDLLPNKEQSSKQTKKRFKDWGHSNPLWILGGAGQLNCFFGRRWSILEHKRVLTLIIQFVVHFHFR